MADCCDNDAALTLLRRRQTGTLVSVLAINAVMFLVIAAAAFYSMSSALAELRAAARLDHEARRNV